MSSVKEQLTILVSLQEAENQILIIEKELGVVGDRIKSLDQQLEEFNLKVEDSKAQHEEYKKQYRDDEREVKNIETQIVKSNEKLRSVKTNKEYQTMLREIDELKKKQSGIEDRMITILEQIENAEKEVAVLQADLADLVSEINAQKQEIQSNTLARRAEFDVCSAKRDNIYETLDSKIQTLYTKVKQQNAGIAVAGILDAVCQTCRMNIPPQLFIELMRMQSILMCPHCQRIIYPQNLMSELAEDHAD
jgi:predicted  nucleic acid-binding Zn-ribbon protein